ncbi:MAG: UDP-N-acetylmuramate--L-alanine ligase [Gemmatimonadetes bacterium]|nr:UDP-N-acetylmuramate--L-alanine ligase [Gemmatimonadota bacterium]
MSVLDTHRGVHFLGIGGAGMSALAELLLARDYAVSGCDLKGGPGIDRLAALGVETFNGHAAAHLAAADLLVVTSAVAAGNLEVAAARQRGQTVIRRAELLGAVMEGARGIAVAGTHGKSTTTAMVGAVLEAAGWDPTVLVGGRIRGEGGNVRVGGGGWLVAEADEFDRSFLALSPDHAVINNIEADHLDTYGSVDDLRAAFRRFAAQVREGGTLVLGIDDPAVRELERPSPCRTVTFGLAEDADVRAAGDVESRGLETRFTLRLPGGREEPIGLGVPGLHNVQNALGAAALGWSLGVGVEAIRAGLGAVQGVERRFEVVYEDEEVFIVDDYAHHPTEITATLSCARAGWPKRRLVAVFQPHLYSRTRDFAAEFGAALAAADVVFVTDIYAAREAPIPGITGRLVSEAARTAGGGDVTFVADGTVARAVAARIEPGDLVLTMGAGDIDSVARRLAAERGER